jgi:beta-lactamase regulating signal transducer with metallopeptidase domain
MSAASIEAIASGWLEFMGERAVAGLLALPVVLLAWGLTRRRASPHLTSALLVLALAPLALPLERLVPSGLVPRPLAAAFSSWRFGEVAHRSSAATPQPRPADREAREEPSRRESKPGGRATGASRPSNPATMEEAEEPLGASGFTPATALFAGWLAVVAFLLARLAFDLRRTRSALRRARPLPIGEWPLAPSKLARCAGFSRLPPIVESRELPAPSTCGVLAATVVLPPGLKAELGDEGLRFVLLHELAHVRRRDPLLALLERLVRIVWFLHPTAWLAGSQLARERERACDDAALAAIPASARGACAEALFRVVERASGGAPVRGAALALTSGGRAVKERLLRIVDPAARFAARMSLLGRAAFGLCVAALLLVLAALVEPQAATAAEPQGVTTAEPRKVTAAPPQAAAPAPPPVADSKPNPAIGGANGGAAAPPADPALAALHGGVAWLLRHQENDGHFSAAGFAARCNDPACSGKGEANHDVGVTALAAEALMGAGGEGEGSRAAARALDWLVKLQDRKGFIKLAGKPSSHQNYSHVLATLALVDGAGVEAGGRSESPFKEPAQRAVDWLVAARNPYRGWRYGVSDGDNDASLTGLIVYVLAGARTCGLEVDREALRGGVTFLDEMTDPESGRTGYQQRGGAPARTAEAMAKFPAQSSEALTAVAMNARIGAGEQVASSAALKQGLLLLAARLPEWDEAKGTIDYWYWYHGTRALFLLSGGHWSAWKKAVVAALTSHQSTQGDGAGSFPAVDAWSSEGGRVYATAINLLTLEICNRDR